MACAGHLCDSCLGSKSSIRDTDYDVIGFGDIITGTEHVGDLGIPTDYD